MADYAQQRHNTENLKQIFPEKELHGLSPYFHIHVSVNDLIKYSHDQSVYSAGGKYVDRSWEYINRPQTLDCGNRDRGRPIPFLGIHKREFHCSAFRSGWFMYETVAYTEITTLHCDKYMQLNSCPVQAFIS